MPIRYESRSGAKLPGRGERLCPAATPTCTLLVLLLIANRAAASNAVELTDQAKDEQVYRVKVGLSVDGRLYPQPGADKALPLKVNATLHYLERRLAGTGREAQSLRAARYYQKASASIEAGIQVSNALLGDGRRLIVARGTAEGMELFSPSGPLTYPELELLRVPADSLAVQGLLPDSAVEPAETWKPAPWVLPLLTGIEAVQKSQLSCKLERLTAETATISFQGEITGAILGASAAITLEGTLQYHLRGKYVARVELTQTEKRAVGAVAPGLDLKAQAAFERAVEQNPSRLTGQDLAAVPLEANEASRLLVFDAPDWKMRFYHDRNWHLFHQNSETAVLRLLDKGGLITQCNIKRLPDAEPGRHVSEAAFEADVARALGKSFEQIVQAERLSVREGLFVYRVVAVGATNSRNLKNEPVTTPMQWNYYLVANADGRQVAIVFSIDPMIAKELRDRDLAIIGGIEFDAGRATIKPAGARK
jgi:hypothetical protein